MVDLTFDIADLVPNTGARAAGPGNRMHSEVETVFPRFGPAMVRNGWSVFPQQATGQRAPALVDGVGLRYGEFQHRLPTRAEVASWAAQCPDQNAAIITGEASGYLFALDVDVEDPLLVRQVRDKAFEHLGVTPYTRFGRPPRMILLYRHEPENKMRRRTYRFGFHDAAGNWGATGDMIEVLANGTPFTAYGHHHTTGEYFKWGAVQPLIAGPGEAPLVTAERFDAFLDAVQDVRGFFRQPRRLELDSDDGVVEVGGMQKPVLRGNQDAAWVEDEAGKVVDGREAFLYRLVKRTVWANRELARDGGETGYRKLVALVTETFAERAVMDGRWDAANLRAQVEEKVSRERRNLAEKYKDGFTGMASPRAPRVEDVQPPVRAEVAGPDSLSFLPVSGVGEGRARKEVKAGFGAEATPQALAERALSPDRTAIAARVSGQVVDALDSFFAEVYGGALRDGPAPVHVLRAPTGAGKTTRTLRYIAEDPRTKRYDHLEADGDEAASGPGPVLFLMPTYNNIVELRERADALNLDASLDDDALRDQARSFGLVAEDDFEAEVAHYRRDAIAAGLRVMIYQGKMRAGCKVEDKMSLLMEAGIPSSGLCRSKPPKEKDAKEEPVERFCPHYSGCPAIEQRKLIAGCHVVFLAHAFFTLKIPDELKAARCVIADERIFHLFVHTAQMHRATLNLGRKQPRLTKREKAEGFDAQFLIRDREEAADAVSHAFQNGRCPAVDLFRWREDTPSGVRTGLDIVRSAKRVCGNAMTSSSAIHPEMSVEQVRELCNMPTGTEVREEWRLWQILEERIEALGKDALSDGLLADVAAHRAATGDPSPLPVPRRHANGARDYRIQLLKERVEGGGFVERIRLSWRSEPNWADKPLMLLDASSPGDVIGKIFNGRPVVQHAVDAPLNVRTVAVVDRTYSNASVVAGANRDSKERILAGRLKNDIRSMISAVSGLYGWGRVVCGASIVVRRAVNTAWKQPTNVDWCHYGAMRGLDFAKNHAAAISVGRMEVPIPVIDGLVAALTYDDVEPEEPYDLNGDQRQPGSETEDLKLPLEAQVVKMRSGQDVQIAVPRYPGRWARIIQAQYREEELSQFLGRLRPVYREGEAPVWFALSKVLPDHVVVDELVTLDDLVMKLVQRRHVRVKLWEGMRASDGVVHPDLMAGACTHLFRSAKDASAEIRRHGLCPDTGAAGMDLRASWGLTPGRVRMPDGSWSWLYVRSDIREPVGVVRNAFLRVMGLAIADGDVEMGGPVRPPVASGVRAPDKIDADIGSVEERASQEYVALTDAAVWAFTNLGRDSFTLGGQASPVMPVPISTRDHPEVGGMTLTTFDIAGAASTDTMWHRVKVGHEMRQNARLGTPGAVFDSLGARADDADE